MASSSLAPLRCSGLQKSFRLGSTRLEILRELDAEFARGGITTIQGASGSGKSTLLQILGGLERPDAGTVEWEGNAIYRFSRRELARWRNQVVGFVFQAYHLFPELSALENVDFPARLARRSDPDYAGRLLDRVGLGSRRHHRPAELSGGEQQRVAIARALRNQPALLLADEPTGNLDVETGREIIDLLLGLHQERQKAEQLGTAGASLPDALHAPTSQCLVIVTHDNGIAALGDQRLRLEKGRLV